MYAKNFCLSVLIVLFSACEKQEETPLDYPVDYQITDFQSTSEVRLFTNKGEIKDVAIITSFVNRHGRSHFFMNVAPSKLLNPLGDTVKIIDREHAIIMIGTTRWHLEWAKRRNELVFIPDTAVSNITITNYYADRGKASQLMSNFQKRKPLYEENKTISTPYGSQIQYKELREIYANGNNQQLIFPIMSIGIRTGPHAALPDLVSLGCSNNQLEERGYTQLRDTDTVAIQEFDLMFERK